MENDTKLNPNEICRTCLMKSDNMKSLTSLFEGENRTLLDALCFVVNYDIKPKDSYPNHVCKDCEDIIHKADAFKRRCMESEDILKVNYEATQSVFKSEFLVNLLVKPELKIKKVKSKKERVNKKSNNKSKSTKMQQINDLLASVSKNETNFNLQNDTSSSRDTKLDMLLNYNIDEKQLNNEIKMESECDDSQMDADFEPLDNFNGDTDYKEEFSDKILNFYTCICSSVFNDENDYKMHLNSCKERSKSTKIKTENKYVKTKSISKVSCIECDIEFDSYKSLRSHRRKFHDNVNNDEELGNFECTKCMRKFSRKSSYTCHMKHHESVEGTTYTCETCKREFQYKGHLDNHILAVHSRDKGFTCDVCSTNFLTQASLDTHKESHKFEKKHKCNVCNKAFYMLSTLNDHLRTHTGEKPYLCSTCGRGFSQRTNLLQHVMRHQGYKPFKCDECEKSFVSKGELTAHKRKHTGAHPFVCDECGSGFTTSSALVKHRRTHTGERPYACDLCPMRFAASGTLNNHRRTHTGEKPYECSYCEKSFVQRQDLVSHIRCHTGERPYMCSCGLTFRKSAALKQHARLHPSTTQS